MLNCEFLKYSEHAVVQMFKRNIGTIDVEDVLRNGSIIKKYLDDRPYPSFLILGFVNEKVIHLVVAQNSENKECVIITAYIPDPEIWKNDYKTKN